MQRPPQAWQPQVSWLHPSGPGRIELLCLAQKANRPYWLTNTAYHQSKFLSKKGDQWLVLFRGLEDDLVWGRPQENGMHKCGRKGCVVCPQVDVSDVTQSYVTDRFFGFHHLTRPTCQSSHVVYVITCTTCGKQYVGETKRTFKTRIKEHLDNIKDQKLGSFLVKHFNKVGHGIDKMKIQVLDTLDGIENTKESLEKRELFWIKALNTAYPFGLNDNIKYYGNISSGIDPRQKSTHPYFQLKATRRTRKHRTRRRSRRKVDIQRIENLFETCLFDQSATVRDTYLKTSSLSKVDIDEAVKRFNIEKNKIRQSQRIAFQAIVAARLGVKDDSKKTEVKKLYLPVNYPNKGMDLLKLPTLFKDRTFFAVAKC